MIGFSRYCVNVTPPELSSFSVQSDEPISFSTNHTDATIRCSYPRTRCMPFSWHRLSQHRQLYGLSITGIIAEITIRNRCLDARLAYSFLHCSICLAVDMAGILWKISASSCMIASRSASSCLDSSRYCVISFISFRKEGHRRDSARLRLIVGARYRRAASAWWPAARRA